MGIGEASAIVSSMRVVDRGLYTKTRILSPGPHRGLMMMLAGQPLTSADLAMVPADADFFAAAKVDPAALNRFVRGIRGLSMESIDRLAGVLDLNIVAGTPKSQEKVKR